MEKSGIVLLLPLSIERLELAEYNEKLVSRPNELVLVRNERFSRLTYIPAKVSKYPAIDKQDVEFVKGETIEGVEYEL